MNDELKKKINDYIIKNVSFSRLNVYYFNTITEVDVELKISREELYVDYWYPLRKDMYRWISNNIKIEKSFYIDDNNNYILLDDSPRDYGVIKDINSYKIPRINRKRMISQFVDRYGELWGYEVFKSAMRFKSIDKILEVDDNPIYPTFYNEKILNMGLFSITGRYRDRIDVLSHYFPGLNRSLKLKKLKDNINNE